MSPTHDSIPQVATNGGKKKRKRRIEEGHGEGNAIKHKKVSEPSEVETSRRNKKSKKKEQVAPDCPETSRSNPLNDDPEVSTTALLSAIVAAAAGTPDLSNSNVPQASSHHDAQHHATGVSDQTHSSYQLYDYVGASQFVDDTGSSLFPTPMGLPFSDLTFASNDDVLRALQDLDMAKITNVLKTLGEATVAGTSTYPGQPGNSSLNIHQPPPPLGQIPVASEAILGIPRREDNGSGPRHRRTLDMSPPATVADPGANQDHAYILANKWLSTNKLAHLVETQGLVYKKGKFSAIEEQQLKAAIDNYCIEKQLNPDQLNEVIFSKDGKNRDNAFWSEITAAIPQRPIIAVYHHVRRAYHQLGQKGKWGAEEDALLAQAVADLGQQWEKVSGRVGRMSSDCRDRYRNHILNRDLRIIGAWTKQEEEELARIMKEVMVDRGKDTDTDIFWGVVSQKMGGKRSRQQCRIKWTDALSKTIKNDGQTPRWGQQDAFILVHKIDSLNVRDDTEIDWQTLPDAHWNLWSAHTLQRRWLTMKRGIKGYEDMTHQEIMDILRVKKAQLPEAPTAPRKRKERKVKSAAAIADSDLQHDAATSPADGGAMDSSHNRPTNESELSESEES